MAQAKHPDHVDIPLSKPITVAGVAVSTLRMREPTVADQLIMSKVAGGDMEREFALVAALCMIAPADVHQLTLRDYKKVVKVLENFTD